MSSRVTVQSSCLTGAFELLVFSLALLFWCVILRWILILACGALVIYLIVRLVLRLRPGRGLHRY